VTFPKTRAVRTRDETICDLLERLSRLRPLSDDESVMLRKTLCRLGTRQGNWRWTKEEDDAVRVLMRRRMKYGAPPPYQANDEVRDLAAALGRSYMAVHRRMERLRKRSRNPISPRKLFKREAPATGLHSAAWTKSDQIAAQ
jgi:hypothetical protein